MGRNERFRRRVIVVDRDVLEAELRSLASEACKWIEGSERPCPIEWPDALEEWCRSCMARRVLKLAETEEEAEG